LNYLSILPTLHAEPKSTFIGSYNSFAGSDIKAVIGQFSFAELQAISYAITREKAVLYHRQCGCRATGATAPPHLQSHLDQLRSARSPQPLLQGSGPPPPPHRRDPTTVLARRTGCEGALAERHCSRERTVDRIDQVSPSFRQQEALARTRGQRTSDSDAAPDCLRFQDPAAAEILTLTTLCSCGSVAVTGFVTSVCVLCCSWVSTRWPEQWERCMGDVKKMISVLIPVGLQDEETSPPSTAGGHFPEMGQVEDFFKRA
jgi:hypothetical protein